MATILEFRSCREDASKGQRRKGASAEIVIFPGVRYERWTEPAGSKTEKPVKASARDILKLVD